MRKLSTRSTKFTHAWTFESNRKPWKTLLASVLRTKHTAPEKKPSDRSNAAMPRVVVKSRCTRARCSNSGSMDCADSKDEVLHRSEFKIQPNCVEYVRTIAFISSLIVCNCCPKSTKYFFIKHFRIFSNFCRKYQHLLDRFSNFLRFRNKNHRIFQRMVFETLENS